MALDQNFKHLDIREALENTHMRGRNITFLDDFSRNEIHSLFQAAKMLEPFMRTGTDLLKGKVLYTLFFQPSTRTFNIGSSASTVPIPAMIPMY